MTRNSKENSSKKAALDYHEFPQPGKLEIRATKPSKIICAKRRYRFLKSPKGVMPTLLEYLLTR